MFANLLPKLLANRTGKCNFVKTKYVIEFLHNDRKNKIAPFGNRKLVGIQFGRTGGIANKVFKQKGLIHSLMDEFRNVPADQKREVGMMLNELKQKHKIKSNPLKTI